MNNVGNIVSGVASGAVTPGLTNWDKFGMGAAAGGMLGGGLYNLFGNNKNPADSANNYLNQIPGATKPYYDPTINAGNNALPKISAQFDQLTNDPAEMVKRFGSGYQQSPGFNFSMQQGQRGIDNAALAGGMAGSPQHQRQAGELATQLSNQDYYNYLNHVIGMYNTGLKGQEGLAQRGGEASMRYGDLLGNNLAGQAAYGYAGQAGQNQADSQGMSNLFGGLGSIASIAGML
jgi:hypothetical protein